MSIVLDSSYGEIEFDSTTGFVVIDNLNKNWPGLKPFRLDIEEWKKHYPGEEPDLEGAVHDILDFGYWFEDGTYVPPEADWRKEFAEKRKQDK